MVEFETIPYPLHKQCTLTIKTVDSNFKTVLTEWELDQAIQELERAKKVLNE